MAVAVAAVRVAAAEQLTELEVFAREVAGCTRCRLAEGRTQVVFGVGSPDAESRTMIGGTIGVESDPGSGSTFYFELPRAA